MIEPTLGRNAGMNAGLNAGLNADGVGLPPLFFRSADRLRLEGCVAGLLRDGRSLAISSTHEAALDHYSRLLISRLRESAPQSPPELYFPADTTAMINRFNEAVSALSVQQAMQAEPLSDPPRIWVVHDAGALANHEVQLLARLVQNFPGANIRVVFLLGAGSSSRAMFDAMDRRFLRWDIEAPTPEQAEAMLAQGREDGCEGAVRSLLKKLQAPVAGALPEADPAGVDPLGFQAGAAAATKAGAALGATGKAAEVFKFAGDAARAEGKGGQPKAAPESGKTGKAGNTGQTRSLRERMRKLLTWVLILLALASLSVGITAWLHPTVFTLDRLDMAKRWAMDLAARPAATALAPAAPASDASAATDAPATPTPPAASEPAADSAAPAPTLAASDAVAAVPEASAVAELAEVEPPPEALAGQAWIAPMPFGTWVVQHAAMPSYQAAQTWQQNVALLADARIVALYRPNDKLAYFAVVSGPFTSRVQATSFTARKGMPADAWVRSARSLKEQFSPATATAGKAPPSQESRR